MKKVIILILMAFSSIALSAQCYEVYFTNSYGSPHFGKLTVYNDGSILLKVRYPDGYGGWNCVQQTGKYIQRWIDGILVSGIECYTPKYCGTSVRNSNYSADNLYWFYDNYGNFHMYNNDDNDNISNASIRQVWCD